MWNRVELKTNAKEILKAKYWKAVLVAFIASALTGASSYTSAGGSNNDEIGDLFTSFSPQLIIAILGIIVFSALIGIAISIFLENPLLIGCYKFFINCKKDGENLNDIVMTFKNGYMNVVLTEFLRGLFTFLWSLLFVIPGIIKGYEYMLIPYLLADNPQMDREEAFAKSKEMMDGNKWKAFVLDLSFFGWGLLSACTCGLLYIFYVGPYIHLTKAELYHALKAEQNM